MAYFEEGGTLAFEQVSLFLGEGFVLTFQEEKGRDAFEAVRKRLRAGRGFAASARPTTSPTRTSTRSWTSFFRFSRRSATPSRRSRRSCSSTPAKKTLRRLYDSKRLLVQLRRAAWPHREILNSLMRDESGRVFAETSVFLRDCYDHITQIIDIVESYRDITAGLMDVYLSSLGFRTNEIMRVLTVVSTFFIPLTFVAGVYGMNFNTDSRWNMPELHWKFGYLFFWGVCATVAGVTFFIVKRKKWL